MATLSALRGELQRMYQDGAGNFLSAVPANQFINNALEDFVNWTSPMLREYAWYVTAYQQRYSLPTDWMKPKMLHWYQTGKYEIPYMSPKEFQASGYMDKNSSGNPPRAFTIIDQDIYLGPAPSASSETDTISDTGGITASDTTIGVATGTDFQTNGGIILIESELIAYQRVSSNNLTLCLRGQGGTTAATHADTTAVKRCDLVATYFHTIPALTADTNSPSIDARWHRLILHRALWQAFLMGGRPDEAQQALQYYETKLREAKREINVNQRDNTVRVRKVYY